MNESSKENAAESDDETLARLAGAVGQPSPGTLDRAKALFAFVTDDDREPSAESAPAEEPTPVVAKGAAAHLS
ncbi:hypothetical protein ACIHFC_34560 [Streptomyces sp. NPDC052013]|uniref:hypothetical protein n=1 Tax=Streptomyces sp. NPDC052013 TaxID=3365679 RepID=UPI0037D7F03F